MNSFFFILCFCFPLTNTKKWCIDKFTHKRNAKSLFGQISSSGFFSLLCVLTRFYFFVAFSSYRRSLVTPSLDSGRDCTLKNNHWFLPKMLSVGGGMDGGGSGADWGQRLGWNLRVRWVTFQVITGHAGCLFVKYTSYTNCHRISVWQWSYSAPPNSPKFPCSLTEMKYYKKFYRH